MQYAFDYYIANNLVEIIMIKMSHLFLLVIFLRQPFLCISFLSKVDTYGTVQPHTLIRQHLDYHHWYDRNKLTLKEIGNTQYVACMNPTAGSFTINPRLQVSNVFR